MIWNLVQLIVTKLCNKKQRSPRPFLIITDSCYGSYMYMTLRFFIGNFSSQKWEQLFAEKSHSCIKNIGEDQQIRLWSYIINYYNSKKNQIIKQI